LSINVAIYISAIFLSKKNKITVAASGRGRQTQGISHLKSTVNRKKDQGRETERFLPSLTAIPSVSLPLPQFNSVLASVLAARFTHRSSSL
jgi:hypothetical protein